MDIIETAKKKIESEITSIEERTDLSDDEKRSRIINIFSVTCAAVAVQPIPFADIFVLTPIQAYMAVRLSAIRGMPLSEAEATDLVKEIAGIVGLGMAAQQIVLGLYKVGLPFLAGFTTIPLVYGLTYAIGRTMDYYLEKKSKGQIIEDADLVKMWEEYREEGKEQAKKAKDEVKTKKDAIPDSVADALPEDVKAAIEQGPEACGAMLAQLLAEDDDDADKQKKAKDEVETKDFNRDVTDEAENKHEETPPIDLDKIFRKNIESMGMGMGPKKQRNDEKDEQ